MTAVHSRVEAVVDAAFRDQWGRLVAILIGQTGDFGVAEESVQEAFALALQTWPRDGIPDHPDAWLITVARRRAVDRLRRERVGRAKIAGLAGTEPARAYDEVDLDALDTGIGDPRLRLIFTCCHPALAIESQVTLALRTLLGLSVAEIARAFGVSEPAMAKRITRTKIKIRDAGIPYRVPPAHQLGERTAAVLGAIYLLANEGYVGSAGDDLTRPDLSAEALRLAAQLAEVMPDDPEVLGLYALLRLQQARAATRTDEHGALVPLEEQDRSRWDPTLITAGLDLLRRAVRFQRIGPYQLQTMIAGCHLTASRPADTDWARIVELYDALLAQLPSSTVRLNRIIAVAMRDGPDAGLRMINEAGPDALPASHLVPATVADLLRRSGRAAEAADHYRTAIAQTANAAERRYLERRLAALSSKISPSR
jgi:RNA polymerase sigma-70 factor (ECF subfamily)